MKGDNLMKCLQKTEWERRLSLCMKQNPLGFNLGSSIPCYLQKIHTEESTVNFTYSAVVCYKGIYQGLDH